MKEIDNFIETVSAMQIQNHQSSAYEGFFGDLKEMLTPDWSTLTAPKALFGKLIPSKVKINKGFIIIEGVDLNLLLGRIEETYGELNVKKMFIATYNKKDYKKFKRRKMNKSQMRIEKLQVHEFFIIELIEIFRRLSEEYSSRHYASIAHELYKKSWLSNNLKTMDVKLNTENLKNLKFELMEYQKKFVEEYPLLKKKYNFRGFINGFVQGMGKTLTAVAISECLEKDKVYIVCPNSLTDNWAMEIKKYYDKYSNDEGLWKKEVVICNRVSSTKAKDAKFMIINNESIPSMYPFIDTSKSSSSMFILDESHNFRNFNSKRTKELLTLVEKIDCDDNLVMSGTPIKAIPNEIVPALMIIDKSFTPEVAEIYNKCFSINSTEAMSIVQRRFGHVIYRVSESVLELPPLNIIPLFMDVKGSTTKYLMDEVRDEIKELFYEIYEKKLNENSNMRNELVSIVKKYSSGSASETKLYLDYVARLNTDNTKYYHELDMDIITSFLDKYVIPNVTDTKTLERIDFLKRKFVGMYRSAMALAIGQILPPRRDELFISLYEDNKSRIHDMILENTRKTVIFSQFRKVITYIANDLNSSGIQTEFVVGGDKDRFSKITNFQNNENVVCLCATSQTLSTGVTLVEANQMFFFGPPWRSADYEQAYKRIHRIGQRSEVNIYNVLLKSGKQNLSTRMLEILEWSDDMFNSAIQDNSEGIAMENGLDSIYIDEFIKVCESAIIDNFVSSYQDNPYETLILTISLMSLGFSMTTTTLRKLNYNKNKMIKFFKEKRDVYIRETDRVDKDKTKYLYNAYRDTKKIVTNLKNNADTKTMIQKDLENIAAKTDSSNNDFELVSKIISKNSNEIVVEIIKGNDIIKRGMNYLINDIVEGLSIKYPMLDFNAKEGKIYIQIK